MGEPATIQTETADQLRDVLDGPWHEWRQLLRAEIDPGLFVRSDAELTLEEHRAVTLEHLQAFTKSVVTPHVAGSQDTAALVLASELLAHADLSLMVKAGVQFGLFAGVIKNLGSERHQAEFLPRAMDGSVLGCFAMTERDHGSDVASLQTTARYEPETDELVINTPGPGATKEYIGNAARDGRMAAVFAQLQVGDAHRGVHCVLVPIRDDHGNPCPGVTIGDCGPKMGLPGVDNGRLGFAEVRVPRTNLLDRYGTITADGHYRSPIESRNRRFFTMLGTLVRGRVSVGGAAAAAAQSGLTLAIRYGLTRRQFTNPLAGPEDELLLLDYQSHQLKLLPLLARSYAFKTAQNQLITDLDRIESGDSTEHERRELEARAAGLKAVQTRHATDTLQICREACGGAGYLAVNRLATWKSDSDVFTTFEGDNTVLLQLTGKSLLTRYQQQVSELDTVGIARFAARQATGAMIERVGGTGLVQRLIVGARGRDTDSALGDRGGQLGLIEDRERHLLDTLASRLRRVKADDPVAAARLFNRSQEHLIATAEAHVERIALDSLVEAIDPVPDGEARTILDLVCDLYVHDLLVRHRAWYLEHGRISPTQAKQLRRRRTELCAELRPSAELLVDAFGIPETWLDSDLTLRGKV